MRALVSRPLVVLIDEVWSGMREFMMSSVRRYLTEGDGAGEGQAVVVITHWEEDVPWVGEEDRLGRARVVLLNQRVVLLVWGVESNTTHIMPMVPTFRPLRCSYHFQQSLFMQTRAYNHNFTVVPHGIHRYLFLPTNTKILIRGKFGVITAWLRTRPGGNGMCCSAYSPVRARLPSRTSLSTPPIRAWMEF